MRACGMLKRRPFNNRREVDKIDNSYKKCYNILINRKPDKRAYKNAFALLCLPATKGGSNNEFTA